MEVPTVNLSACGIDKENIPQSELERAGKEICDAFSNVGLVYLTNTGIPKNLVDEVNTTTGKFFQMNTTEKEEFSVDENYHGYVGFEVEGTNPKRPPDLKEAYNVRSGSVLDAATFWPDHYVPDFSKSVKNFYHLCDQLSRRILELLTAAMSIKEKDYLLRSHSGMSSGKNYTTLRSLYYPPIPASSKIEPGQVRLGEHTDYGTFTLLFQDNIGGLEVEDQDGKYFEVLPIPDTVLVNAADILQYWTKGRFKSPRHRIMIPKEEIKKKTPRRSLVFFVHPNYDVTLSKIECEDDRQSHVAGESDEGQCAITAFEYVNEKLRSTYY